MSMKPSEYGVMDGCVQTAMTYLFLLEWQAHMHATRRVMRSVPERLWPAFVESAEQWVREYQTLTEEMHFCATLLGDTAHDLYNIWEDARMERQLDIKRYGLHLILNATPGKGKSTALKKLKGKKTKKTKKNPYVFDPEGGQVKFVKPRSLDIADVLMKGNK